MSPMPRQMKELLGSGSNCLFSGLRNSRTPNRHFALVQGFPTQSGDIQRSAQTVLGLLKGNWNHCQRENAQGFTLIEVMVAVAILAMITVLSWQGVVQILNAEKEANNRDEAVHAVTVTFDKLFQDITQAFLVGQTHKGIKATVKPGFVGTGSTLDLATFSCRRFFATQMGSDQCEVGYYLDSDEDYTDLYQLMRREAPVVDDKPTEGGKAYPLLAHVSQVQFEFYDQKSKEWKPDWNSTQIAQYDRLPAAVRIVLHTAVFDGDERIADEEWKTAISIPLKDTTLDF